jgi:Smr domain
LNRVEIVNPMKLARWLMKMMTGEPRRSPFPPDDELPESDPADPFPHPVEIVITDVFDLHTILPQDVKRVVEEYLTLARDKGYRSVRIIHGKGIGVQREMVRSILARTPFVADWTDAPPEAGGLGATIVRFQVNRPA